MIGLIKRILKAFNVTSKGNLPKDRSFSHRSGRIIENDKLIIIHSVSSGEIISILSGFINNYDEDGRQIEMHLTSYSDSGFSLKFPSDIDFDIFCYLLNYLSYPIEMKRTLEVNGWSQLEHNSLRNASRLVGQPVMLFIPAQDTEYDNIYLVSQQNETFKVPFSSFQPIDVSLVGGRRYRERPDLSETLDGGLSLFFR